jgi:hypothetical protein
MNNGPLVSDEGIFFGHQQSCYPQEWHFISRARMLTTSYSFVFLPPADTG